MKIREAIDYIFSHNEIVALWEINPADAHYSNRIWKGMAWEIPDNFLDCENWKIFGTIPNSIVEADVLNIRIGNDIVKKSK